MKNDDVDLIQRILSGDEYAFTTLVQKHRKWVHSLAWQEIGDFHVAQEITQDTFIHAFNSLPTLRDPKRFLGWLRVIAKRRCVEWIRKKPLAMQSIDAMPKSELERLFYVRYLEKEQSQASTDRLREVVENLLQKLPTSERSVIALHYFKGLTCEEVSARLDVSLNTVKSRLYRARKRLEKEESMIRENLSPNLLKSEPRYISIQATTVTESGEHLAEGGFRLNRTDEVFTSSGIGTRGHDNGDPSPMYMLLHYINHGKINLFRFPVAIGKSWEQAGAWKSKARTTLEGYEEVEVSAGVFHKCLKHKTVFTNADVQGTNAELQNALVNGTRYLWFAKGVGLVKMRYEHANGVVTEAKLFKYEVPLEGEEYLPVQVGTQWTYRWQNSYRDEAVFEKWHVIRNFSKPVNLENPLKLASARYEITIDADEPRVAEVKCILTPKIGSGAESSRKHLMLSMSQFLTEWLYDGYARYLRDLTVTDANGETLPIEEIDKTQWVVETQDDSPVTLHYKALLEHDKRDWPTGRDEEPYTQEDCIFWTGYALFIVGKVKDIELQVNVPDNWHVSTAWERIEHGKHRFVCKDQNDLMNAYLVLGEHCERLAKSGGAEIVLAIGGRFKASMDKIQSAIEAILRAYTEIFDDAPKDRMLFVANPYGAEGFRSGGASGRSITTLMGGELDETNKSFWANLVAGVVCYMWNGQAVHFAKQEYWFTEGFTSYYSNVVCTRLGLISESDFLIDLKRSWKSYLSEQGKRSIREAGKNKFANRELVYDGGSLIAMALDLQIRSLTQNRNSLDDVMKQMYKEFGLTENVFTINDVIRIVNQFVGEDFEPFFSKYVIGTERLPLEEYLKNAGIDAQVEFGEKLPNLRYILNEMLSIRLLRNTKAGSLIIFRSSKYQDGDKLLAINGTPVRTFDDIRRMAKDWKSGDVVALTLEREGKEITLPITLGGMPEKPSFEAASINITITQKPDSTEAQRAIWAGILGDNQ